MEPESTPTFVCNLFYSDIVFSLSPTASYDFHRLLQDIKSRLSEPEGEIVLWKVSTHCADRSSPYLIPIPQLNQPVPIHPTTSLRARVTKRNNYSEFAVQLSPSSPLLFDPLAAKDHVHFLLEVRHHTEPLIGSDSESYSRMFTVGPTEYSGIKCLASSPQHQPRRLEMHRRCASRCKTESGCQCCCQRLGFWREDTSCMEF